MELLLLRGLNTANHGNGMLLLVDEIAICRLEILLRENVCWLVVLGLTVL